MKSQFMLQGGVIGAVAICAALTVAGCGSGASGSVNPEGNGVGSSTSGSGDATSGGALAPGATTAACQTVESTWAAFFKGDVKPIPANVITQEENSDSQNYSNDSLGATGYWLSTPVSSDEASQTGFAADVGSVAVSVEQVDEDVTDTVDGGAGGTTLNFPPGVDAGGSADIANLNSALQTLGTDCGTTLTPLPYNLTGHWKNF
jgi:hypothetical protein